MELQARLSCKAVLVFLAALATCQAYNISVFPFENCVQNPTYSRFSATLYNYTENAAKRTSRYCIQLHSRPADECTPGKYRCCKTSINKIKFLPAPGCQGSLATAVIDDRHTVNSIYWEWHQGYQIVKITPLMQWLTDPDVIDDMVVCVNLRPPCWRLPMLAFDGQQLNYALYDKKVNNYECCPLGKMEVPQDGQSLSTPNPASSGAAPPPKSSPPPIPFPTASPSPRPPSPRPPSPSPKGSPPSPRPSPRPPSPRPPSPRQPPSPRRRSPPRPPRAARKPPSPRMG